MNSLLLLVKSYKWLAVAAVIFAAVTVFVLWLRGVKADAYAAGRADMVAVYDAAARSADEDRTAAEAEVVALAHRSRERMQGEIQVANSRAAALLIGLQQRADRPSSAASADAPGFAVHGTGAGLSRSDGQFLVGEAAAAQRIASERDLCRKQYADAQLILERLRLNSANHE